MPTDAGLNFLPKQDRLRMLQAGTFVAVITCFVLVGALLGSSGKQTATLSDALTPPIGSASATVRVAVHPKAISENAVVSAANGGGSDIVRYFEATTGKAFSVDLRTQKTGVISDIRAPGFIRSFWLPFGTSVVSEFQDPVGVSYRVFDYKTKTTTIIGSDISALAVSPDGRQIAYLKPTEDALELFVSDTTGENPRKLLTTRAQEAHLDWPAQKMLSIASRRPDRTGTDLTTISLDGALTVLMSNLDNLEYVWSHDGSRLLFSYFTQNRGVLLWYRDVATGDDVPLGIATSARKCAWNSNSVITCGIPVKSSLTQNVPADHSATIDDVVTLDLVSGQQHRIYGGSGSALVGVIEPLVSSSGRFFVFTNIFDSRLYLIPM